MDKSLGGLGVIVGAGIGLTPVGAFIGGPAGGAAIGGAAGGLAQAYFADDRAEELQEEQLRIAREQRARWEEVFGPVQDSLSETIRTLTPESFAASGIAKLEQGFERVGIETRQRIAQRNLEGSGLEQDQAFRSSLALAEGKAQVRINAETSVRDEKMNFLRLGLTQPGATDAAELSLLNSQERLERANSEAVGGAVANLVGTAASFIPGQRSATPEIMPTPEFTDTPQQSPARSTSLLDDFMRTP